MSAHGAAATLPGERVLVVGLGASGAVAARALAEEGSLWRVVDGARSEVLEARAAGLRERGAEVLLGVDLDAEVARLLDGAQRLVVSPGVPEVSPLLRAAAAAGLPVWSEPELAWRRNAGRTRLVGVTGTNGKTTTTELVAACLGVPAAGNIGTPLVEAIGGPDAPALAVAELSSFQLRYTETLRPDVAVLLNLAEDHLDWHGDMTAYRAAKARLWSRQGPQDWMLAHAGDAGAAETLAIHPPPGRVGGFTLDAPAEGQVGIAGGWVTQRLRPDAPERVAAVDALRLEGPHNLANACAAAAAALCAGGDPDRISRALRAFTPGPHRLELVTAADGVRWVDDSKATNPHAAAAAIAAYPSVVWIAGGLTKGMDFAALAPVVAERVRVALTIGSGGPEVAAMTRGAGVDTIEAGTLDEAVRQAARLARPGDTVLLSPACASMDQFRDYAERGAAFRAAVTAVLARRGGGAAHVG